MSDKFKIKRTVQCAKCPWKVSTNPFDIPDGYCELKHKNLENTIAKEGELNLSGEINVMACHHSTPEDEEHCVGWLHNQLGVGNNIGLRISMMNCENINELTVKGKQHEKFEETLPENKKPKTIIIGHGSIGKIAASRFNKEPDILPVVNPKFLEEKEIKYHLGNDDLKPLILQSRIPDGEYNIIPRRSERRKNNRKK